MIDKAHVSILLLITTVICHLTMYVRLYMPLYVRLYVTLHVLLYVSLYVYLEQLIVFKHKTAHGCSACHHSLSIHIYVWLGEVKKKDHLFKKFVK